MVCLMSRASTADLSLGTDSFNGQGHAVADQRTHEASNEIAPLIFTHKYILLNGISIDNKNNILVVHSKQTKKNDTISPESLSVGLRHAPRADS